LNTPLTNPFGSLCIVPQGMYRVGLQSGGGSSGTCTGAYAFDFNLHYATQTLDPNLVPGAQVDLQCWYRDSPNPGGANLTQAASFLMCP
jgi:hypothetical protein